MTDISILRDYLYSLTPMVIDKNSEVENIVLNLLSESWHLFAGSDQHSTHAYKLNRAEELTWNGKELTFLLERHGQTTRGSTRASVHLWTINPLIRSAICQDDGVRQVHKSQPRLDLNEVADCVIQLVKAGVNCDEVTWVPDKTSITINLSAVLPIAVAQTARSRNKRFRALIAILMRDLGWVELPGSKLRFGRVSG
jgi:hypothetical protein